MKCCHLLDEVDGALYIRNCSTSLTNCVPLFGYSDDRHVRQCWPGGVQGLVGEGPETLARLTTRVSRTSGAYVRLPTLEFTGYWNLRGGVVGLTLCPPQPCFYYTVWGSNIHLWHILWLPGFSGTQSEVPWSKPSLQIQGRASWSLEDTWHGMDKTLNKLQSLLYLPSHWLFIIIMI